MVSVACATQTLVKRVCMTLQHRARTPFINQVMEKGEAFPRPYFFSQNALSVDFMCWVSREVICHNTAALSNFVFLHCPLWKSPALVS